AAVASRLFAFLRAATTSLDIAVYDAHFDDGTGDELIRTLNEAEGRGVRVRAVYNDVHERPVPIPPPPHDPSLLQQLAHAVPAKPVPGVPDLMHHKYVVRDGAAVWTGSTNWTADSWTREENVIVTVASAGVAARYLEDFEQLWRTRDVARSGKVETAPVDGMRAWFCPGRGERLAHRIAKAVGSARRRVRVASPVLSSAPILATLAQVA